MGELRSSRGVRGRVGLPEDGPYKEEPVTGAQGLTANDRYSTDFACSRARARAIYEAASALLATSSFCKIVDT